ncbi:MAG: DUF192 domain-containing protein [Candidatus Diapherotrites archaeon]|nr:DUF192 domain-containing protein [Candidatus Diapherotrites archaeon]
MDCKRILSFFYFVIVSFLVFGCIDGQNQAKKASLDTLCIGQKACIQVERAITPKEHSTGLMFQKSLPPNSGMLFLFEDSKTRSFWMKNTLIPLDIIWIDEGKKIAGIAKNVQPCKSNPCQSLGSVTPVKFVLEVNAGFSEIHGLAAGDFVEFSE